MGNPRYAVPIKIESGCDFRHTRHLEPYAICYEVSQHTRETDNSHLHYLERRQPVAQRLVASAGYWQQWE